MRSFRIPRAALAALASVLLVAACGDDDDDPTEPRPDAGITAMRLSVGQQMVTVDSAGNLTGELDALPFGPIPVMASFLGAGGQPAGNITPARYSFEVVFGDSLALAWAPGTGFAGTLTTMAGGTYTMTFRLRDTNDDGTEIFLTRTLPVDLGYDSVRLVFGDDTLLVDAVPTLPDVLDSVPVGPVPVSVTFLAPDGSAAPLVTPENFSLVITSSDTNIVAWTPQGPFSGTLRGVAPGVASIAVRLRSEVNGALSFRHVMTVVVE